VRRLGGDAVGIERRRTCIGTPLDSRDWVESSDEEEGLTPTLPCPRQPQPTGFMGLLAGCE
jgi:hypothetical protein